MKVPLEPIPTDQIVLVSKEKARAEGRVQETRVSGSRQLMQLDKAYPWLLGASTCLSALLCWMYISKPVIVSAGRQAGGQDQAAVELANGSVPAEAVSVGDLVPSNDALPGSVPSDSGAAVVVNSATMDPSQLAAVRARGHLSDTSLGWETTNLKVQHILMADTGNEGQEKIVLDVPVLYQTRTMRWAPADVAEARAVLARLMVYERNLSNLRHEGQTILKEWNELLEETVPAPALRADSPSLPYNYGQGSQSGRLLGGSAVIKVEQ